MSFPCLKREPGEGERQTDREREREREGERERERERGRERKGERSDAQLNLPNRGGVHTTPASWP